MRSNQSLNRTDLSTSDSSWILNLSKCFLLYIRYTVPGRRRPVRPALEKKRTEGKEGGARVERRSERDSRKEGKKEDNIEEKTRRDVRSEEKGRMGQNLGRQAKDWSRAKSNSVSERVFLPLSGGCFWDPHVS